MAAGEAQAQRSGGSFGGGGFGRRSGGSSRSGGRSGGWGGGSSSRRSSGRSNWGSGSRRSGRSTTSWGSNRSTHRSSGGGGTGVLGFCCLVSLFGVVGLVVVVNIFRKSRGAGAGGGAIQTGGYVGQDAMYVSRLSLGIDWRARRELQDTLNRLAQTGDTSSPQGLANLLRETALALRRVELSWLYISQEAFGPLSPQDAEQQFNLIATRARAQFQTETVRGWGGDVQQQQAPEMQANKNEGEGTVVVHLVIGAYRAFSSMQAPDANQIRMALDNRAALTSNQLGALEVIWSPSAENDRMSTAELEQNYPDMRLIDPNSIAGRIFCTYCQGPFAMELLTCPHCGAPAEASRNNRAPRGAG